MPRTADVIAALYDGATFSGAGVLYVVQTTTGVLYAVFANQELDVEFRKSTDGGITWSQGTIVFTGSTTALAVWYDRWSNIAAGLIHMAYTDSGVDDTFYRTINTESSDALSTQTTIFTGTTTAANGHLSITRAVGGNVYCKTCIDAGAEGGFFRLLNANVPNGAWDAARTVDEALSTLDQMILLPDYDAADTQDIMAFFWDGSANEISRKLYDDSANSWSETSIATGMTDLAASTAFPNFAAAMDIANTRHWLVAWSDVNLLNADLRCWRIDSTTITEVTNVVLNSTNNQGLCGISLDIDTGYLTVWYGGKSNGTETWLSAINIYKKVSTDSGTTWGPETLVTNVGGGIDGMFHCPRFNSTNRAPIGLAVGRPDGSPNTLRYVAQVLQPVAGYRVIGGS